MRIKEEQRLYLVEFKSPSIVVTRKIVAASTYSAKKKLMKDLGIVITAKEVPWQGNLELTSV